MLQQHFQFPGDFITKGKYTIDKLFTVAAFKLNQGVTNIKLLASD
ncbi:hypothetical protein T08_16522 [Trichinella sp. T8]|nr:hypothetical protein T08_16522 [Trichinella sp. T8]